MIKSLVCLSVIAVCVCGSTGHPAPEEPRMGAGSMYPDRYQLGFMPTSQSLPQKNFDADKTEAYGAPPMSLDRHVVSLLLRLRFLPKIFDARKTEGKKEALTATFDPVISETEVTDPVMEENWQPLDYPADPDFGVQKSIIRVPLRCNKGEVYVSGRCRVPYA